MQTPPVIVKISDNGHPSTRRLRTRYFQSIHLFFIAVAGLTVGNLVGWSPNSLRTRLEVLPKEMSTEIVSTIAPNEASTETVPTIVPKEDSNQKVTPKRKSTQKKKKKKKIIPKKISAKAGPTTTIQSLLSYSSYDDYNSCEPTTSSPTQFTEEKQEAWNKWLKGRFPENVTHYQQLWNTTTHSIHIPNKHPDDPPTSLEILQDILRDHNDFELVTNSTENSNDNPECFRPRLEMTQKLVDCGGIPLAYPILNLGFPKDGSSTLFGFFQCTFRGSDEIATHDQFGRCNRQALEKGTPPISGCRYHRNKQALMQMDQNHAPCVFPQISMLDEIHQEHPNATFVLNFRPVNDWIRSASNWRRMAARWKTKGCINNIPGLVALTGMPPSKEKRMLELQRWWCSHIQHVRGFVKQNPSHKLIELDLYDNERSAATLSSLFNSKESCWGQRNENKKKTKKENPDK